MYFWMWNGKAVIDENNKHTPLEINGETNPDYTALVDSGALDNLAAFEPEVIEIAFDEIIAQGIEEISGIVAEAYTKDIWKAAEYSAKKVEAEYIIGVSDPIDANLCRILTLEAVDKSITVRAMAAIVETEVIKYEAMVAGARQSEIALIATVLDTNDQATNLAAKAAIITAFAAAVAGGA